MRPCGDHGTAPRSCYHRASVQKWRAGRQLVTGQLRAVEVRVSNQAFVPFGGGWPCGQRPPEAKRPLSIPAGEIQVDPATLPENIELMRQIDEQLAQSDEASEDH